MSVALYSQRVRPVAPCRAEAIRSSYIRWLAVARFAPASPLTHCSHPTALRNSLAELTDQDSLNCPYLTAPALAAGHLPSARPQAAMSHSRQIQAPPSFAATTLAIIRLNRSRRVSCSLADRSAISGWITAARAAVTRSAIRRPRAVSTTDRVRPSRPAERVTKPSASRRSTSRTAPDGVRPNTECRRSSDGRSRKWVRADSAVAAETDCAAAWAAAAVIWSATTRARAPRTLASAPGVPAAASPEDAAPLRVAGVDVRFRGARSVEVVVKGQRHERIVVMG